MDLKKPCKIGLAKYNPCNPKRTQMNAFKRYIRDATSTNQKAKMLCILIGYIVMFFVILGKTLDKLGALDISVFWYISIIFAPLIYVLSLFYTDFLGIIALFVCGALSLRFQILRNYALLYAIYLICAMPSLWLVVYGGYNMLIYDIFDIISIRNFYEKGNFYMIVFGYCKQISWVFLYFGIFDVFYFWFKKLKIPRLVWCNVSLSIVLYISSAMAYCLYYGEFAIQYFWWL